MLALRRTAAQSARRISLAKRTYAADHADHAHPPAADAHHDDHGHHGDHAHHDPPKPESFGTSFYICLGIVPLSMGTYVFSRTSPDGEPGRIAKLINSYSELKETLEDRNALHTKAVEQAGFDKNLFYSSPGSAHIDLRFPEIFNTGSPYNVVAGQGPRGMDALVAHYENENRTEEARREAATAAAEAAAGEKKQ